jgi:phosphopantothenoylcysteine decarboxylase/phosphopantothenate--cysteine ligase
MHFLITAGGTREFIDPVRFVGNASSGRMGYALAQAALRAGHKVTLISASVSLKPPKGATLVQVVSAADMYRAVRRHFRSCDCLIMAAAVSDYTPTRVSRIKLKKTTSPLALKLKPTADIIKWAGRHKGGRIVVGFALEDRDIYRRAEAKLRSKRADMIVANQPGAIGAAESSLAVKTASSDWLRLPCATKLSSARKLIALIEKLTVASR